ncbi:MAG: hypothetical protein ABSB00_02190 [Minisyncoccia bacterium]|jgi:hypothetical protein
MQKPTERRVEYYLKIIIAIAAVILAVLCVMLVREYKHLRRIDHFTAYGPWLAALHARSPLGASDASSVQTWMTFDYINHLFALPSRYVQTTLHITDSRYPRLTVAEYAEDQHMKQLTFLAQVQNAIRAYFAQKQ